MDHKKRDCEDMGWIHVARIGENVGLSCTFVMNTRAVKEKGRTYEWLVN
jgi:hypothetical protein